MTTPLNRENHIICIDENIIKMDEEKYAHILKDSKPFFLQLSTDIMNHVLLPMLQDSDAISLLLVNRFCYSFHYSHYEIKKCLNIDLIREYIHRTMSHGHYFPKFHVYN